MRESMESILLERKAKRLRKSTGNPNLRSAVSRDLPVSTIVTPDCVAQLYGLVRSGTEVLAFLRNQPLLLSLAMSLPYVAATCASCLP
jgi:hypothetical protein